MATFWNDDERAKTDRQMAYALALLVVSSALVGGLMGWIAAWLQIPIN